MKAEVQKTNIKLIYAFLGIEGWGAGGEGEGWGVEADGCVSSFLRLQILFC